MLYHNRLSLEQVAKRRSRSSKPIGDKIVFGKLGHKGSKGYESSKNSTYNSLIQSKKKEKGKHASSTESRRLIWEQVVWPLVLEKNRQYFTLREYRIKSNEFSRTHNIQLPTSRRSGGLISLMNKGILKRDKGLYSIHYKLVPYLRKKANLDYGTSTRGTYTN
ncbi:MAG TPA: hypothetical protein VFY41_06000 [Nitrososphaeraceae archaeon]|nr:hypothetical protein [Nitrososphaeraceae archaeon]